MKTRRGPVVFFSGIAAAVALGWLGIVSRGPSTSGGSAGVVSEVAENRHEIPPGGEREPGREREVWIRTPSELASHPEVAQELRASVISPAEAMRRGKERGFELQVSENGLRTLEVPVPAEGTRAFSEESWAGVEEQLLTVMSPGAPEISPKDRAVLEEWRLAAR